MQIIHSLRKPIHTFLFLFFLSGVISTSSAQTVNYEAANWKTWFLENPQQIKVAAPPSAAQSKSELQTIRKDMGTLDPKKMEQIKYWDAGAPSYRWNELSTKLVPADNIVLWTRTPLAWMNVAIYDATILAWKEKIKYKRPRPQFADPSLKPLVKAPMTYSYPCEHSVTAAAAAYVLAYFLPEKADSIIGIARLASQSRIDAGVAYPSDVAAGWKLGEDVARQIIERAKNDGSNAVYKGEINKDPKKWTGSFALGINIPLFRPMVLSSAAQFRPPAPPDFSADMKELKNFKRNFSSNAQAYYWANSGGYEFWNDIASRKMFESRISDDAPAVARIYSVLHIASHETVISVMDAKYAYWGIRPNQYDTTYKSLLQTPPFPGYPSGHAMFASTSATVLEYFFPAGAKEFQKLAKDCADSRFYAGIHFRTDNEVATQMGKVLGKYVAETLVKQ
jgi:membrane-associated phospholipid phosphatase